MYKLLTMLRERLGKTQSEFAEALGTDQAQISKLESGKAGRSFEVLCGQLRKYARAHPWEWLELLAAGDASTTFQEYKDLFFISEEMHIPFDELWVVADVPAECQQPAVRIALAGDIKRGASVVYWVPEASREQMRTLAIAFHEDHGLDEKELDRMTVIRTPPGLTLLPMAIVNPTGERRIGVLAPETTSAKGVRVVVLPTQTTTRLVQFFEPIYRELQVDTQYRREGFEWTRHTLADLARPATSERRK